ncbi:MAG: TMEM14 family protein [Cyanobacteria bacterium P01_A01_bin.114]
MSPGLIFALIYGVLAIVGGIIGYRQAGSKVSLISGIVSGLLLLLGVALMPSSAGFWLAKLVSLVLVIGFVTRLVKTKKFMPAGLMVIVGVATLIALFFG